MKVASICVLILVIAAASHRTSADDPAQPVPQSDVVAYFARLQSELRKDWPRNRTIRFVFHGHSVPAGYFKTPLVRTFDAYPTLFHQQLCEKYPTAVIDVCVTAIGGENSIAGAERFEADVLALKPDVVFIDYALNDRGVGLEKAEAAWRSMIEACVKKNMRVVLLTPTPDTRENILDDDAPLAAHAEQVRQLAAEYRVPIVDSYAAFRERAKSGNDISSLMSQVNHPNRAGHEIVAQLLAELLPKPSNSPPQE